MKTLRERLDDYVRHAESRNQSQLHILGFRYSVLKTIRWLEEQHGVFHAEQLTSQHIDALFRHLTTRRTNKGLPLKITTVSKLILMNRVFVAWLGKIGASQTGLPEFLPMVKLPYLLPTSVLTHDKMTKLLDGLEKLTPDSHRQRAMLEVLYSSGIRAAELLSMNVDSVDLTHGVIRVFGKGAKERVVPIGQTARRLVESYLRGIRPLFQHEPGETALWLNRFGARMPYHTFRRELRASVVGSGVKELVTAHTFRRSCATELIRSGANLWHVKDLLGHENVETLNHYVKLMIVDLKKTHKKCHPRERDSDAR